MQKRITGVIILSAVCLVALAAVFFHDPAPVTATSPSGDGYKKVSSGGVDFEWKVDGNHLRVRLRAKTGGWVAAGFNPKTKMKGADFIIGYVKNGRAVIHDEYGTGFFSHKPDTALGGRNNIADAAGSEKGGVTELSFKLPLNSGDKNDAVLKPGSSLKLLLAHGSDNADNVISKHAARGSVTIKL